MIYDNTQCNLGEGPLWHPLRQELFWFDINAKRLHSKARHWQFDEHVSAAGWVDHTGLLIASESALFHFNLQNGQRRDICPLEADNPITRSNDGRADPYGGFWIGTMGKNAESRAGAIWRYYKGALRKLVADVTISNAICFCPSGKTAYYTDTKIGKIMRCGLDPDGWPKTDASVHIDLSNASFGADGAVVDADGNLWNAQWGAGQITQYGADGKALQSIKTPGIHSTCPAFGGPNMTTLFCTSATEGMANPGPDDGKTFAFETKTIGQAEHQVRL